MTWNEWKHELAHDLIVAGATVILLLVIVSESKCQSITLINGQQYTPQLPHEMLYEEWWGTNVDYDKAPIDASLTFPLDIVSSDAPTRVRLVQQTTPLITGATPVISNEYQFSVKFSPITTISLGGHQNAVLVNVRTCNTDPTRSIILPQEELILTSTNLNMLTTTQATWLLTQKAGKQWATQAEQWGSLGMAVGAALTATPYVAMAIPLLRMLVDFFRSKEPNINPFLMEMLPAKIPLAPAGQAGECTTGSMFASKKGNKL